MKTETTPKTVRDSISKHLEPMVAAAATRAPKVVSWVTSSAAMLVGSEGRAVTDFRAANPHLTGTLVIVEWVGMDSDSSDSSSMGPAITLMPQRDGSPLHQLVMSVDEARALIA